LTKPIGSGVLFNANIKNWVSQKAMEQCIETLIMLNKTATEVMEKFDIHAATDITGFGIAGHSFEMAKASGTCLEISVKDLPIMTEALDMYKKGMSTGVNAFNRKLVADHLRFDIDLPVWHQEIVFDPQTSGGLMVAVPTQQASELIKKLHAAGVSHSKIIGNVSDINESCHLIFK
jgi:selenide,water dikinase